MDSRITLYEGRAKHIGTCVLVEAQDSKVLLDCGLPDIAAPVAEKFNCPFSPAEIDAVILSHGHLGHCGLLPQLVADGFRGRILCAHPTKERACLNMLEASLVRHEEFHRPEKKASRPSAPDSGSLSFYTKENVAQTLEHIEEVGYCTPIEIAPRITATLFNAGHTAGSAVIRLDCKTPNKTEAILYLPDVGEQDNDLYHPRLLETSYDAVILPSPAAPQTEHRSLPEQLADIINAAHRKAGNVIISAFSLDRRIDILNTLNDLMAAEAIPSTLVFLDSPASLEIDGYFRRFKPDAKICSGFFYCDTVSNSKCLNNISGTTIVVCGSDRDVPGRLQFHLKRNLPRPESALVLLGRLSNRTLCGALQKNAESISIHGESIPVNAAVHTLFDPSLHISSESLGKWIARIKVPEQNILYTHPKTEDKE